MTKRVSAPPSQRGRVTGCKRGCTAVRPKFTFERRVPSGRQDSLANSFFRRIICLIPCVRRDGRRRYRSKEPAALSSYSDRMRREFRVVPRSIAAFSKAFAQLRPVFGTGPVFYIGRLFALPVLICSYGSYSIYLQEGFFI